MWSQVAQAVADAVGPELTGIRLSPFGDFGECTDPETVDLNLYLVDKLSEMGLVYLHAVEPRISGASEAAEVAEHETLEPLRKAFKVCLEHGIHEEEIFTLCEALVPSANSVMCETSCPRCNRILSYRVKGAR